MKQILLLALTLLSVSAFAQQPTVIKTKSSSTLIPEGIAVDTRTGDIYVSSIWEKKIIRVKQDGSHNDFIKSGSNGFWEGLGMKLDEKLNRLWALSNKKDGNNFISMIHVFNSNTGALDFQYELADTTNRFFNDLVLDGNGNAYITATMGGGVYFADTRTKKVNLFLNDSLLQYPNGIELKGNRLYIATYSHGLITCNIDTKKLVPLTGYSNKQIAFNLDGLGFYGNKLYGVYNGDSLNTGNAIVEYTLHDSGESIIAEKNLDKGHSLFKEPTTLAIAGNKLYLLSNSHLGPYNRNKESAKGIENELSPPVILVYTLK